jgi:exodeoxyribonuclease-3
MPPPYGWRPQARRSSFRSYARNAGLRIDHLLLTPDLARRLKRAAVDTEVRGWEKTSNHAPVWIELKNAKVNN